ncbi:MAG: LytTR family DNA-binding domain-containing protein [Chitinophagales bacterium]
MRVLIIEDEHLAAEELKEMLSDINSSIEIVDTIDTVKNAIEWLRSPKASHIDLIFLDIHLADGNSFSIFEEVKVKTPIIFTTAYDQYAIRAFKLNSIAYLLKPIDKDDLEDSLEKFEDIQTNDSNIDFTSLIEAVQKKNTTYQKRFIVTTGDKIKSILTVDVAYFMSEGKYLYLTTKDGKQFIVDFTLSKLEKVLQPDRFFRINRKFIINFDAIKNMVSYSKSRVKIELNPPCTTDAIVSVDRSGRFKQWLNR